MRLFERDKFTRASVPTGARPDSRQSAGRPFLHSLLPHLLRRFLSFPRRLRNRLERPTLQSEKRTKAWTRRDGADGARGPGTVPRGAGASGRLPKASAAALPVAFRWRQRRSRPGRTERADGRPGPSCAACTAGPAPSGGSWLAAAADHRRPCGGRGRRPRATRT